MSMENFRINFVVASGSMLVIPPSGLITTWTAHVSAVLNPGGGSTIHNHPPGVPRVQMWAGDYGGQNRPVGSAQEMTLGSANNSGTESTWTATVEMLGEAPTFFKITAASLEDEHTVPYNPC